MYYERELQDTWALQKVHGMIGYLVFVGHHDFTYFSEDTSNLERWRRDSHRSKYARQVAVYDRQGTLQFEMELEGW